MIILILLLLLMSSSVQAATYWVSSSQGSDAGTSCISSGSPPAAYLRTIARGITCLSSGDTLNIRSGTYNENFTGSQLNGKGGTGFTSLPTGFGIPSNWGVIGTPTIIQAYLSETVTINGVVSLSDVGSGGTIRYLIFKNLIFDITAGGSIYPNAATGTIDHIKFDTVDVRNLSNWNADGGLVVFGANSPGPGQVPAGNHHWFINGRVHDAVGTCNPNYSNNNNHAFYVQSGDNIIETTEIYNIPGYGIHQYNEVPTPIMNANIYRNNYIHDTGLGRHTVNTTSNQCRGQSAFAILLSHSNGSHAYGNLLVRNQQGVGISTMGHGTTESGPLVNISNFFYNNTVYGSGAAGFQWTPDQIANGICCYAAILIGSDDGPVTSPIKNNIVWANNINSLSYTGPTVLNNSTSNPLFVDAANPNCTGTNCAGFHLTVPGSSAINAGTASISPSVIIQPCPANSPNCYNGSAPDIGAYESGVPDVLPVVSISASPPTVNAGGSSTLTWSSDAASCLSSTSPPGANSDWPENGSQATSGNKTIAVINATTEFYLDCTNAFGTTIEKATVTISGPGVNISASPSSVNVGGSSILTWSTTNAASCLSSTSPPGANSDWPEKGSQATSGNKTIAVINITTEFYLDCTNAFGTTSQKATVTITPGTPVDLKISAITRKIAGGVTIKKGMK